MNAYPISAGPMSRQGSGARVHTDSLKDALKIKCVFSGKDDEDYDLWWSNIQSKVFILDLSEADKIKAMDANLEGEARRYLETINVKSFATTEQFHESLKTVFSEQINWHNRLNNCRQRADEKIRPFAIRLRITATKSGRCQSERELDRMCVSYLHSNSSPEMQKALMHCLPNIEFDTAVQHLTEFENREATKKSSKRKNEDLDVMEEVGGSEEKIAKQIKCVDEGWRNTSKQVNDKLKTHNSMLNNINEQLKVLNTSRNESSRYEPYNRSKRIDRRVNYEKKPFACFLCLKNDHSFNNCPTGTKKCKDELQKQLRDRSFNFAEFYKRLEVSKTLNSSGATTSSPSSA